MLRSLAGGGLYGETWGDETPVAVALHGWRRTHADFAASLGPAAPGGPLACLAPDLPGFGATPAPAEPWGSVQYAGAVAHLLEETGGPTPPHPLVVVGPSLGGRIAVRLAAARPDLAGALVLTGAPLVSRAGGRRRSPVAFRVARALHRSGLVSDERMERARQRHGSADYRAAQGVMRQVLVRLVNENYDDALATVPCPVELVWGEDDAEAPVETARALEEVIPQARLTVCASVGHLLPISAPDELRAAVERALARRS